ncbi:TIGR02449 family protein [Methylococcus sp. EFPC2]|uniref:TIGR02449 family protein n=1 Tax=Methylococcus sp. EFPC2 TaxID=2812648 RepID=UPI0019689A4B|nr:TIGR02449 family protein [Methylococcus sp. EFPC2]QSA96676.1 TIGR02449 family protein [Methylococcus sp. EFPC2]
MNSEYAGLDTELIRLQEKIEALVTLCEQLRKENVTLKARFEDWSQERALSAEKTALARNRIEAMITRLKSMGQEP